VGEHAHTFPDRHHGARRTVGTALAITLLMGAVEVVGGILSNSLALLGDAAHMFTDSAALALAYAGVALLARPPSQRLTFGWHRFEVLGALLNGVLLVGISGYVLWAAWQRLLHPQPVEGPLMMGVALLGLVVNVVALALLHKHESSSLGARGAFLHILSDAVTSVATIVAGALVWLQGLVLADAVIAVLIVAFVLRGALGLLRDSGRILLEAASPSVDPARLEALLRAEPGVVGVHDVHAWSLTRGVEALTAHVEVQDMPFAEAIALKERLKARLHGEGVDHVVLELDLQGHGSPGAGDHAHGHAHPHPRERGPGHGHGHDHPH
jgi:cobalt-zinc-cadmium efflux system protein